MLPGLKLEIFHSIIEGKNVAPLLDGLQVDDVMVLQNFLWEKTVEIGLKVKGKYFNREEVTSKMIGIGDYQKKQGCPEPESTCKGYECIPLHSECAVRKMKDQIEVMATAIHKYFKLAARNIQEPVDSF